MFQRKWFAVLIAFAVIVGIVGGISPAIAAQDATIQSITLNGCFIDVTFQVEDAGNYFVNVWDDGNFRAGAGGAVPANGTMTVRYVIGDPILEGAPGIGISVGDALGPAAVFYDLNDTYPVPASVGDPCAAANDTTAYVLSQTGLAGCDQNMNISATSVVGAFVADTQAYSAPGVLTSPAVNLQTGKTAWVLGQDASGQFYKIVWVCTYLWVPKASIGPNFDATWQGRPLPTGVVQ